tara:strand:- start:10182 stop:11585 length:1404 start_codon:yes stop_codon:yes gene_type:complete
MGGGLMQLVAYGAQDIYLTGNPQITFFKVVYRRHTNFSMEAIEQTFNGSADFGKRVTCTVSRNGDLMHRVYLQVTVPAVTAADSTSSFRWVNWLGHVLIKNVEVEIGGQRIDKHYGDWMHIWNELTQTAGHKVGYANMVGNVPRLTQFTPDGGSTPEVDLYIPLEFWFCRNPGLSLPLIALQYHEVKINLEFRSASECYAGHPSETPSLEAASLYVDYIYLDTDERRRFAQVSHEYLIEQLQFTGDESVSSVSNKIKLNFNHPCKELVWVVQKDDHVDSSKMTNGKQWFNYTDAVDSTWKTGTPVDPFGGGLVNYNLQLSNLNDSTIDTAGDSTLSFENSDGVTTGNYLAMSEVDNGFNPVLSAKLQLNGHDRFSERLGRYFNLVQPYQHHTNVPATGINVYSFGLKPEEHQPSGTCNMSRIDNATLQLTLTAATVSGNSDAKVRVYATNYNVLRIMSGMGGLAYSN